MNSNEAGPYSTGVTFFENWPEGHRCRHYAYNAPSLPARDQPASSGITGSSLRPGGMRELGWRGPRLMRWGEKALKGYWRHPTVGLPAIMREEPVAEVAMAERETLAPELEAVTRLGLKKIAQILALPTDPHDGHILRA